MQPPFQPATPQEPAPKKGQKNYPNIEKFNEESYSLDCEPSCIECIMMYDVCPNNCKDCNEAGKEGPAIGGTYRKSDEEEGRWDRPSTVVRNISCPECNLMQRSLDQYPETPQPNLELAYKEHLSKVHGMKTEEEEIDYFRCEYCGELIDPVEEYHTHKGKKYYGHSKGEQGIGGWTFDCPKCNGTGKIGDSDCDKCDGTGGVYESGKHYKPEERQNAWCYRHDKTVNEHNDDELDEDEEKGTENYEEPDPSNPDRELKPDPDIPEPVEPTEHVTADGLDVPDKVEIPERLYNDLMMMIEYSTTNDNEAGGFLIVAKHGELGVVGEQFGKDREIVLEPNEQLHEGEQLIGTVHMHPVTPTASTGDVGGYMNDENEKVMVVVGADKSINVMFKTDFTAEGDYGDEISDNFEQEDMNLLAEGLGFIWYRGEESDRTTLNIVTNVVDDVELNVVDETWPIEDLVKALGIKGRPDIPESYSTKKQPLKLQIPFSWKCNERRLI